MAPELSFLAPELSLKEQEPVWTEASADAGMGDFIVTLTYLSYTAAFTNDGIKVHSCVT